MKGSKTCPSCQSAVGPRTKLCACGHEFQFKTKEIPTINLPRLVTSAELPENDRETQDTPKGMPMGTILVPAGKCPVAFKGSYSVWVSDLKSYAAANHKKYAPSVFTYWAGMELVDKFSDEGRVILKEIEQLATN